MLLTGDSILNGYLPAVTKALEGKASVDAWVTPTNQGDKTLPRQIAEGFHWKSEGTALLVKQVSDALLQALAERAK